MLTGAAGTVLVVRFNWPKYLGVLAILTGAISASAGGAPRLASAVLWAAALPGLAWTVTSLAATWWVYDHRRIYEQVTTGLSEVGDWAAVHAGFDGSGPALSASIGRAPVAVAQIAVAPGPSLRRARKLSGELGRQPGKGLLLAAGSADSIFVTFAAHEVRDRAEQVALFGEFRRALRSGGQLVITEHQRDLANFAVYGLGVLHFQPLATWHARAAEAGLSLESQLAITPFVRRLVYRR